MAVKSDGPCGRIGALTIAEQSRLTRILGLLASPYEGERASAALLASAFVAKHGLGWGELTALLSPVPDAPPDPGEPPAMPDRRHHPNMQWRGYCRRQPARLGTALDRLS